MPIEFRGPWLPGRTFRRLTTRAIEDGFELIHLLDARLAPIGADVRHRLDIPVTADVKRDDVAIASPSSSPILRALERLDTVFAHDGDTYRLLRDRAPYADTTALPTAALPLPRAGRQAQREAARALAGIEPDRFLVAVPAGSPRELRNFVDAVLVRLEMSPLCVVIGVPHGAASREATRELKRSGVRVLRGQLDAEMIAAVAPYADAFALPSISGEFDLDRQRYLTLASSGAPVIAADCVQARNLLLHEQNAFLVDGSREVWSATLNGLFALPAVQRQCLGDAFATRTSQLFPLSAVVQAYDERFSSLLGRPQIPLDLRAA